MQCNVSCSQQQSRCINFTVSYMKFHKRAVFWQMIDLMVSCIHLIIPHISFCLKLWSLQHLTCNQWHTYNKICREEIFIWSPLNSYSNNTSKGSKPLEQLERVLFGAVLPFAFSRSHEMHILPTEDLKRPLKSLPGPERPYRPQLVTPLWVAFHTPLKTMSI